MEMESIYRQQTNLNKSCPLLSCIDKMINVMFNYMVLRVKNYSSNIEKLIPIFWARHACFLACLTLLSFNCGQLSSLIKLLEELLMFHHMLLDLFFHPIMVFDFFKAFMEMCKWYLRVDGSKMMHSIVSKQSLRQILSRFNSLETLRFHLGCWCF